LGGGNSARWEGSPGLVERVFEDGGGRVLVVEGEEEEREVGVEEGEEG